MAQEDKELVTFPDGERIAFTPKKLCIKKLVNDQLRFYFRNGSYERFDPARCSPETKARLVLHGASQKAGDEGAKPDVTTADDFHRVVRAMILRLYDGTAFDRAGGERIVDRDLFDAMVALGYIDEADEEAVAAYRDLSAAERKALAMEEDIAQEIAKRQKEAAKGIDVRGLLANKFKKA